MSLSEQYRQQYPWRPWDQIYRLLGDLTGQVVLDLGCGIGDQAADLARLGADVIGVDRNESLVEVARAREIPRARFVCADLSAFDMAGDHVDGIWLSFTAAYFPRIQEVLDSWSRGLVSGGWMAVTEVDDLFGHECYRKLIEEYYARSLGEGASVKIVGPGPRRACDSAEFLHRTGSCRLGSAPRSPLQTVVELLVLKSQMSLRVSS